MDQQASVIVVGAGVIGCSVAFQLARMGQRNVVVLEREPLPGAGSTSRANGGIRAQFTTEANVRMSLLSMEILDALEEEIGQPPAYRKAGYLFLTDSPAKLAAMERAAEFQRGFGVDVEVLDAAEVRRRVPWVAGENLAGGTFGARDGFIDPGRLCGFFASAAAHDGVSFRYGQEVVAAEERAGGFVLRTADGSSLRGPRRRERGGRLVRAAGGPPRRRGAGRAGSSAPLSDGTGPRPAAEIPMTIDADTGVLVRREGERVLVAWSNADEPPGFDTTCDPEFVLRFADALEARFPSVAAAGIDQKRSWAGLYEVTPDHHAILGPVEGRPGLLLATGFSGHGVMHAPAAGRCVAEMIVRGRSESVDVAALSLGRFARGELIHETMVL